MRYEFQFEAEELSGAELTAAVEALRPALLGVLPAAKNSRLVKSRKRGRAKCVHKGHCSHEQYYGRCPDDCKFRR